MSKLREQLAIRNQPVDIAKALDKLSPKEMACFKFIAGKKIVPLEVLRHENKSFIGALGRLTRLNLAEVLPYQPDRVQRMVCLVGVIPQDQQK